MMHSRRYSRKQQDAHNMSKKEEKKRKLAHIKCLSAMRWDTLLKLSLKY